MNSIKEEILIHNQQLQQKILLLYKVVFGDELDLSHENKNGREKIGTNQYSRTAAGSKRKHN
jgi:hypothetical protein